MIVAMTMAVTLIIVLSHNGATDVWSHDLQELDHWKGNALVVNGKKGEWKGLHSAIYRTRIF